MSGGLPRLVAPYRDRAAFDAHEGQPPIRRFLAARELYLASVEVDSGPVS